MGPSEMIETIESDSEWNNWRQDLIDNKLVNEINGQLFALPKLMFMVGVAARA
jgi:hypothetical protein